MNAPTILGLVGAVGAATYGVAQHFRQPRRKPVVRLRSQSWTARQLTQHVLITGATGSGKTRSGIVAIVGELFRNDPAFGGLFVDAKGVLHEELLKVATEAGRPNDVLLLTPGGPHRFNLVGDTAIPPSTLAQCVVDTAAAIGGSREQTFFRRAAQIHVAKALDALREAGYPVTLENAHNLLVIPSDLRKVVKSLKTPDLIEHFQQFAAQPPEQLAGVVGTIQNYLEPFTKTEVAELFCRDSTFSLSDIDRGRIICLAMPQRYQTDRRFVGTFLKLLFYNHALARFDRPAAERESLNQLVLLMDECQQFLTVSEHGMSDHNVVDMIREAKVAVIAATQSTTSLVPALGADEARVFTLNMRNRLIFTAADEQDARASAEFLGKRPKVERTTSWQGGRRSESTRIVDEFVVKPHELRGLRKHECIVIHCDKGHRKMWLPPREADGSVSRWYRPWWLGGSGA